MSALKKSVKDPGKEQQLGGRKKKRRQSSREKFWKEDKDKGDSVYRRSIRELGKMLWF